MIGSNDESPQLLSDLNRDQLEVYAREVREHFREEQRLRQEMEGKNQQLEIFAGEVQQHYLEERRLRQETELRIREITALNQLFQKNLNERFEVINSYLQMIRNFKYLAQEMQELVTKAEAVVLPDDVAIPNADS